MLTVLNTHLHISEVEHVPINPPWVKVEETEYRELIRGSILGFLKRCKNAGS